MQLPKIEIGSSSESPSGAVVLGWFQEKISSGKKEETKLKYAGKKEKEIERLNTLLEQSKHFSGKSNSVDILRYFKFWEFPSVLSVGLGDSSKWTTEGARQAGASVKLAQKKLRLNWVSIAFDSFVSGSKADLCAFVQAFCEGYWLAGYSFKELKSKPSDDFEPKGISLIVGGDQKELGTFVKKASILSMAVMFARNLGDQPPNYLTPTEFANTVQRMCKEHGLKCTVLGKKEIEREKMGLFLGVAKGSAEEPKFIIVEHRGGKKTEAPIALVGKGITFDSGGISLKPASKMEDMKYDMMGAAAVAAICQAASELKIPRNISGYIAATENLPGGKAQKPGDVARSSRGKTVEIINTDAEGRLILGDALEYAQKSNPQVMIDFATLTGSIIDAIGTVASGIMGNNRSLIDRIKTSSEVTGERVWELPLYDEYMEDLKSNVADIKNSGIREAGACKGGIFLKFFVDSQVPWVHCDIAGSAYFRKDVNYHPQKYGAGVMIRLMVHLLENWSPLS